MALVSRFTDGQSRVVQLKGHWMKIMAIDHLCLRNVFPGHKSSSLGPNLMWCPLSFGVGGPFPLAIIIIIYIATFFWLKSLKTSSQERREPLTQWGVFPIFCSYWLVSSLLSAFAVLMTKRSRLLGLENAQIARTLRSRLARPSQVCPILGTFL